VEQDLRIAAKGLSSKYFEDRGGGDVRKEDSKKVADWLREHDIEYGDL
jgi:hypothetical protein